MRNIVYLMLACSTALLLGSSSAHAAETQPSEKIEYNGITTDRDTEVSDITNDSVHLGSGTIIVNRKSTNKVVTPLCTITISGHAAALVRCSDQFTSVIDLCDWRYGGISIEMGGKSRSINPGGELAVFKVHSQEEARDSLLADKLNRRKVTITTMSPDLCFVKGEVSILDTTMKQPFIRELRLSEIKDERSLFDKIVKTAAILQSSSSEPYAVHQ